MTDDKSTHPICGLMFENSAGRAAEIFNNLPEDICSICDSSNRIPDSILSAFEPDKGHQNSDQAPASKRFKAEPEPDSADEKRRKRQERFALTRQRSEGLLSDPTVFADQDSVLARLMWNVQNREYWLESGAEMLEVRLGGIKQQHDGQLLLDSCWTRTSK